MTAAETVKRVREHLHLTQQGFATELNLSRTAVFNYECGARKPKLSVIKKIKEIAIKNGIEISIDDFLN